MKPNGVDLKALAAIGAGPRMAELAAEIRRIRAAFPSAPLPLDIALGHTAHRKVMARVSEPRRRRWTASQRKAVSMRMRRYWRHRKQHRKAG